MVLSTYHHVFAQIRSPAPIGAGRGWGGDAASAATTCGGAQGRRLETVLRARGVHPLAGVLGRKQSVLLLASEVLPAKLGIDDVAVQLEDLVVRRRSGWPF